MRLWGSVVWPWWLGLAVGVFLPLEIYALATNPANTLSDWVWRVLRVGVRQPVADWSAAHYLTFGTWLVLVSWLTVHFFFRRFT